MLTFHKGVVIHTAQLRLALQVQRSLVPATLSALAQKAMQAS
jgi:hypothetical protein